MVHTYDDALQWIHSRLRLGVKPGLKRMEWMLSKLNNPEKNLKAIHIGGTNGKGSTVTYLRSILMEAGYEIGTFTSPYIESFNERISLNGRPIADEDIISLVNVIKPLSEELEATELGGPTEFEVITAMAFYYFGHMKKVDFTIFEVGLGGRYDSTNCVIPIVSFITNVGMDHVQILGATIKEIAYEKAGIIKNRIPILTTTKNKEALAVIKSEAEKNNSPIYQLNKDFEVQQYTPIQGGEQFSFVMGEKRLDHLQISLMGKHQTENASGALAILFFLLDQNIIQLQEEHIRSGLKKAYWPARFEFLNTNPIIIIDGAHNVEGIKAFQTTVKTHFPNKKCHIVFAALKDKDLTDMFTIINQMNANIYVTEFDFPRAATAVQLKEISRNPEIKVEKDWKKIIKELVNSIDESEVLAITGSLYFISQVKPFLLEVLKKRN